MAENTKNLQPHQLRVIDEQRELQERLDKLTAYITKAPQLNAPIGSFYALGSPEQVRLMRQKDAMTVYNAVLLERIAAF